MITIHLELIPLDFLVFIWNMAGSPHDLIFSDSAQLGDKTPLSNLFDKQWMIVLDEAAPTARGEEKTFHSVRYFGNTEMIRQLVIDPIRDTTLGHEGKTVNSRIYKKGFRTADLNTTIAAIPNITQIMHPYDWIMLTQHWKAKVNVSVQSRGETSSRHARLPKNNVRSFSVTKITRGTFTDRCSDVLKAAIAAVVSRIDLDDVIVSGGDVSRFDPRSALKKGQAFADPGILMHRRT